MLQFIRSTFAMKSNKPGSDYDMADLLAENRRLRAGLEQTQGDVLRLSRALEPMHRVNEELAALQVEATLIRAERDSHRERAEQLTGELAQRHAELGGLREDAAQLARELAQLRGELVQVHGEAERQRAVLQACRERNMRLEEAGQADREHIDRLTAELRAVFDSSSWRLTGPMRWLKRCLSRTTPGTTLSD
jgi:chromosome segregation ATPase